MILLLQLLQKIKRVQVGNGEAVIHTVLVVMHQIAYYRIKQDNSTNKWVVIPPPSPYLGTLEEYGPARPRGRGTPVPARMRTAPRGRSLSQLPPRDTSPNQPVSQSTNLPVGAGQQAKPNRACSEVSGANQTQPWASSPEGPPRPSSSQGASTRNPS